MRPSDLETRPVEALVPYAKNSRTHSDAQVAQIAASITEFGFTNPVLIDADGGIIAGHGRVLAAQSLGMGAVPVLVIDHLTETQRRAYVIADNKLALNAGWDDDVLRAEIEALGSEGFDLDLIGFDADELDALLNPPNTSRGTTDEDDAPNLPIVPTTVRGDTWLMGPHRLMCGDATIDDHVAGLLAGKAADTILTDPPYCSGGYQEAGKNVGSIGGDKVRTGKQFAGGIVNDKLSTRGYLALMKSVVGANAAPMVYAFTDWKMWQSLYDVAESSG